jgi:hypothetical protein
MAEGQRVRKLGTNMKPRGRQGVKRVETNQVVEVMPTAVGQAEEAKEAVLDHSAPAETGANLEPENGEKTEEETAEKELMVAHETEDASDLTAALNESAETEKEQEPEWPTHCAHDNPINKPCKQCEAADMGRAQEETKRPDDFDKKIWEMLSPKWRRAIARAISREGQPQGDFGLQPDGSLAFRGIIPEEYVEPVTQWADENDVPLPQWCNDRLYEYISTYGSPAQGR